MRRNIWPMLIVCALLVTAYYMFIGVPAWKACREKQGTWQECLRYLVR